MNTEGWGKLLNTTKWHYFRDGMGGAMFGVKLYRVEITVMVLARNELAARVLAASECRWDEAEAHEATSVPDEWWEACPYIQEDYTPDELMGLTVGELLTLFRERQNP